MGDDVRWRVGLDRLILAGELLVRSVGYIGRDETNCVAYPFVGRTISHSGWNTVTRLDRLSNRVGEARWRKARWTE